MRTISIVPPTKVFVLSHRMNYRPIFLARAHDDDVNIQNLACVCSKLQSSSLQQRVVPQKSVWIIIFERQIGISEYFSSEAQRVLKK